MLIHLYRNTDQGRLVLLCRKHFSKQNREVSSSLRSGERGKQWNKLLINEKIITSSLAGLPEHKLGKEKWKKNKIAAYLARDRKKPHIK